MTSERIFNYFWFHLLYILSLTEGSENKRERERKRERVVFLDNQLQWYLISSFIYLTKGICSIRTLELWVGDTWPIGREFHGLILAERKSFFRRDNYISWNRREGEKEGERRRETEKARERRRSRKKLRKKERNRESEG